MRSTSLLLPIMVTPTTPLRPDFCCVVVDATTPDPLTAARASGGAAEGTTNACEAPRNAVRLVRAASALDARDCLMILYLYSYSYLDSLFSLI